jgi:phage baseplate assembly protein W
MGTFIYQPFTLRDGSGAIAVTDDEDRHLRDKIMNVLFTAPGERVNNPRFGVGLDRSVFEPLDDLTVAAVEFRIGEGIRRELSDDAVFDGVEVATSPVDGQLLITIRYRRRAERLARILEITL